MGRVEIETLSSLDALLSQFDDSNNRMTPEALRAAVRLYQDQLTIVPETGYEGDNLDCLIPATASPNSFYQGSLRIAFGEEEVNLGLRDGVYVVRPTPDSMSTEVIIPEDYAATQYH